MARSTYIAAAAAALTSSAALVSAFVGPVCPAARGRSTVIRMKESGAMSIQTGGGIVPPPLDLSGMNYKLGVQALRQFQEKRQKLLSQDESMEPVEQTMKRFNTNYGRPVIPFYRTTLYELVQGGHLAVTDASFMYTHFFAYGFLFAFETVFKGYPIPNEWIVLFEAAAKSAQLSPDKIRKDADALKQYMSSGKTQEDFIRALASPSDNPIEKEIYAIKHTIAFLPERYFSFGLCKFMEALGVEVTWDSIKVWCEKIGLDETRTQLDWDLLERSTKKLGELETLMKQVEIREKKKLAERLEEKAKKAAEQAAASLASSSGAHLKGAEPKKEKKPVTA